MFFVRLWSWKSYSFYCTFYFERKESEQYEDENMTTYGRQVSWSELLLTTIIIHKLNAELNCLSRPVTGIRCSWINMNFFLNVIIYIMYFYFLVCKLTEFRIRETEGLYLETFCQFYHACSTLQKYTFLIVILMPTRHGNKLILNCINCNYCI